MRDAGQPHPNLASVAAQAETQPSEDNGPTLSCEQLEEQKLMSKYGGALKGRTGGNLLIKNKMKQHRKFFDSGDYQMNKQKVSPGPLIPHIAKPANPTLNIVVADDPTPTSPSPVEENPDEDNDNMMEIPRPETVSQRKSSIIYPMAASKLSPTPLHQHVPDSLIGDPS